MINENQLNTQKETPGVTNEELKLLLDQNLALLKDVHDMTHKIKSYITFQKAMSFVYLVLIIGPIIFSIFYLPPLLKQIFGQYGDLLNLSNPAALIKSVETGTINK